MKKAPLACASGAFSLCAVGSSFLQQRAQKFLFERRELERASPSGEGSTQVWILGE